MTSIRAFRSPKVAAPLKGVKVGGAVAANHALSAALKLRLH